MYYKVIMIIFQNLKIVCSSPFGIPVLHLYIYLIHDLSKSLNTFMDARTMRYVYVYFSRHNHDLKSKYKVN